MAAVRGRAPRRNRSPTLALALGVALALAALTQPALATRDSDDLDVSELRRKYGLRPAAPLLPPVMLEVDPNTPEGKCVPNVPNIRGILPSSCCNGMKCPIEHGVCCDNGSHCCPAGSVCVQGDPGTPPGCLRIVEKNLPLKRVTAPQPSASTPSPALAQSPPSVSPPPPAALAAAAPASRYEDAFAPATDKIALVTAHHGGDPSAVQPQRPTTAHASLPPLPSFPPQKWVPPGDPSSPARESAATLRAPIVQGGGNPLGPRAIMNQNGAYDSVVGIPRKSSEDGELESPDMPNPASPSQLDPGAVIIMIHDVAREAKERAANKVVREDFIHTRPHKVREKKDSVEDITSRDDDGAAAAASSSSSSSFKFRERMPTADADKAPRGPHDGHRHHHLRRRRHVARGDRVKEGEEEEDRGLPGEPIPI